MTQIVAPSGESIGGSAEAKSDLIREVEVDVIMNLDVARALSLTKAASVKSSPLRKAASVKSPVSSPVTPNASNAPRQRDIVFAQEVSKYRNSDGHSSATVERIGFFGIPDVRSVEKLVRDVAPRNAR
jgi:hypothetical protein